LQRLRETKQLSQTGQREKVNQLSLSVSPKEVVTGVVQEVKPYGVFVTIGSGVTTLLPISQITGKPITNETLQMMFEVGPDKYWHVGGQESKAGVPGCSAYRHAEVSPLNSDKARRMWRQHNTTWCRWCFVSMLAL
jgi:hypothetical protein